jgi:hypothetical protein
MDDIKPPALEYASVNRPSPDGEWKISQAFILISLQVIWYFPVAVFFDMSHPDPTPKRLLPDFGWVIVAAAPALLVLARFGLRIGSQQLRRKSESLRKGDILLLALSLLFIAIFAAVWLIAELRASTPWAGH